VSHHGGHVEETEAKPQGHDEAADFTNVSAVAQISAAVRVHDQHVSVGITNSKSPVSTCYAASAHNCATLTFDHLISTPITFTLRYVHADLIFSAF